MAELNDPVLIDDEMARPRVAKIIAPDLIAVIDHDGILDFLLCHGIFNLRYFLFVIDSRYMDTDNHEAVFAVLVVHVLYMRHRFGTERAIESPEIDEYNFPA